MTNRDAEMSDWAALEFSGLYRDLRMVKTEEERLAIDAAIKDMTKRITEKKAQHANVRATSSRQ